MTFRFRAIFSGRVLWLGDLNEQTLRLLEGFISNFKFQISNSAVPRAGIEPACTCVRWILSLGFAVKCDNLQQLITINTRYYDFGIVALRGNILPIIVPKCARSVPRLVSIHRLDYRASITSPIDYFKSDIS